MLRFGTSNLLRAQTHACAVYPFSRATYALLWLKLRICCAITYNTMSEAGSPTACGAVCGKMIIRSFEEVDFASHTASGSAMLSSNYFWLII